MDTAQLLLSEKLITKSQYEQAYLDNMAHGSTMGFHLIQNGAITSDALVEFQMDRFGLKRRKKSNLNTLPGHVIRKVTRYQANKYRVLPISTSADVLLLGITEPTNHKAMDIIANHCALSIQPILVSEDDMSWALNRYYSAQMAANARDTMPLAPKEGSWDDEDAPRDTMSWGINIEDALTRAVSITSAKQTHRNLISVVPPPPPQTPTNQPETATSVTRDSTLPLQSIAPPPKAGSDLPQRPSSSKVDEPSAQTYTSALAEMRHSISIPPPSHEPGNERPTIIPKSTRSSLPATQPSGLDSWASTAQATDLQAGARPELKSYLPDAAHHRDPPPSIAGRMSIMPPHKAHIRTEGELLHEVITTNSRDEIISLALEYMLRFSGRALFLIVKKTEIRGFHIAGEYTNREAVQSFWIPFNTRSTLGQVATSGQTYLGPIGHKPADDVFCAALGGRPSHALVVPIILRNRTIGILFADRVQTQEIAWPRLNKLTDAITASLNRFIHKEKQQRNATQPSNPPEPVG